MTQSLSTIQIQIKKRNEMRGEVGASQLQAGRFHALELPFQTFYNQVLRPSFK